MRGLERGLLHPRELIARHQQSVDMAASSLDNIIMRRLEGASIRLSGLAEKLGSPSQCLAEVSERLTLCGNQMDVFMTRRIDMSAQRLHQASRLLEANSYQRVLDRGFVLVTNKDGQAIKRSADAPKGAEVILQFADDTRQGVLDGTDTPPAPPQKSAAKYASAKSEQKKDSPFQSELF